MFEGFKINFGKRKEEEEFGNDENRDEKDRSMSRRDFLKAFGVLAGAAVLGPEVAFGKDNEKKRK